MLTYYVWKMSPKNNFILRYRIFDVQEGDAVLLWRRSAEVQQYSVTSPESVKSGAFIFVQFPNGPNQAGWTIRWDCVVV